MADQRHEVRRLYFRLGRELNQGEKSRSGLYALVTRKGGTTLRLSLLQEVAEELCDHESRYLTECWLL